MKEADDGEDEIEWSSKDNKRVTKIGKLLRRTSLDELPQLWNVIRGDMSLIGPRPERPFFVKKYEEEIPRYMIKHQVRPGMTGWAQVHGLRGDTSVKQRIEYDLYYIENWSLLLDMRTALWTVFSGFINENAR
jgi:lipopolysaccharide/colanic/teichoic acid biosynthesis glycosyltransferase